MTVCTSNRILTNFKTTLAIKQFFTPCWATQKCLQWYTFLPLICHICSFNFVHFLRQLLFCLNFSLEIGLKGQYLLLIHLLWSSHLPLILLALWHAHKNNPISTSGDQHTSILSLHGQIIIQFSSVKKTAVKNKVHWAILTFQQHITSNQCYKKTMRPAWKEWSIMKSVLFEHS